MSAESRKIDLYTWTCDVPGCVSIEEIPQTGEIRAGPGIGWVDIELGDDEALVLCPQHRDMRAVLRTVLHLLERRAAV